MRVARKRLLFYAICVVDDAVERARDQRLKPYPALRLALAILHLHGAEHATIERLWRALRSEPHPSILADQFGRQQEITASMNGLCREAGMERTHWLEDASRKVRKS